MQNQSAQQLPHGAVNQVSALDRACYLLATGFFSGKSPVMPGTAGTAAAALLFAALQSAFPFLAGTAGEIALALAVTVLGTAATAVSLRSGQHGAGAEDPQEIVADEFAGYAVTLLACPPTVTGYLLGFILFRIFDMTKPPPIRWFERLPGALGIVADDIIAGIVAALAAAIVLRSL